MYKQLQTPQEEQAILRIHFSKYHRRDQTKKKINDPTHIIHWYLGFLLSSKGV